MLITEVYQTYKIMPQLQLHMLRVAGVASMISESCDMNLDRENIIKACLLHDMGNILKSKIGIFKEHYVEGVEYWENIKADFEKRYGKSDHLATEKIVEELGVSDEIKTLVNGFGFKKTEETYLSQNLERKVCVYSDMRTSPTGVTSLEERLSEVRDRYSLKQPGIYDKADFDKFIPMWTNIETQIFTHSKIKPEEITEASVLPIIEKLKNIDI